eukprot:TRINITY_DN17351_c0_g1_i1.p1 TRINITY_DN17351_c0_g1~~TRINITY_DN17351_c0_g1_i1.p1  ORF type:complete len:308 (+),score=92.74 TRINITY_DN17351_c0_g1_i1:79-1002(+)
MATAALRARNHGQQEIQPLTKPEAIRVMAAEDALRPFQDEKLEIYTREHDDMAVAFDEAREGRGVLAKLYDQRNKEVLDRLLAMRAKTDREAKKHLDRLKAYSKEFESSVAEKKRGWKQKFVADRNEITLRSTNMGETITGLDADLLKEHEDCLAHAAAETEPLLEALARHRVFLKKQVNARWEENDRFEADTKQRFTSLRKRLSDEEEARRTQGDDLRHAADGRFRALDAWMENKEPQLKKRLEEVRQRMKTEHDGRAQDQETTISNMMRFMAEFEQSISEAGKRQEKTKAHLLAMKAMLREENLE